MAQDITKHLERARKSLEKNKLREAIAEYQAVFEEAPANQEALQALADIYTRLNEPSQAAEYYGIQFDRLVETGDGAKASAVFVRFLRNFPQPSDRLMRYATLLQKQNRTSEAIEQFGIAAELYGKEQRDIDALACFESMALLDPENPQRHIVLGEHAERLRLAELATRSYLRAGQLTLAVGALDEALEYFGRANHLSPQDRAGALLFADAKLRKGDAEGAVILLDPLSANEADPAFLALFGEGLLRTGRLDGAREVFEGYYKQRPESFAKLFELAGAYLRAGQDEKGVAVLVQTKTTMRSLRKDVEFAANVDRLAATYPASLSLAQMVAKLYEELNRETKYFEALMRLFDLYLDAGGCRKRAIRWTGSWILILTTIGITSGYRTRRQGRSCFLAEYFSARGESGDRFDAHGWIYGRGSGTLAKRGIRARRITRPTGAGRPNGASRNFPAVFAAEQGHGAARALAELFPGEEERNDRLRALYERANWWPKAAAQGGAETDCSRGPRSAASPPPAAAPQTSAHEWRFWNAGGADGGGNESGPCRYRGNQPGDVRQPTPQEVFATTAAEIGKHLKARRCLVASGAPVKGSQGDGGVFRAGKDGSDAGQISPIASMIAKVSPDAWAELNSRRPDSGVARSWSGNCARRDAHGQGNAGAIRRTSRRRRASAQVEPNESFFLQAVGDQLVLSVNHTRLRSLVRSLAVAEEKTGLLSRELTLTVCWWNRIARGRKKRRFHWS